MTGRKESAEQSIQKALKQLAEGVRNARNTRPDHAARQLILELTNLERDHGPGFDLVTPFSGILSNSELSEVQLAINAVGARKLKDLPSEEAEGVAQNFLTAIFKGREEEATPLRAELERIIDENVPKFSLGAEI